MSPKHPQKPMQKSLFDDKEESASGLPVGSSDPSSLKISMPVLSDLQLEQLLKSVLALTTLDGIGFKSICNAYDTHFLWDIWQDKDDLGDHPFVLKTQNAALSEFSKNVKAETEERSREPFKSLKEVGIQFTAQGHSTYPTAFYRLSEPPRWLFVQGAIEVLHSHAAIALVGTRTPSSEGLDLARQIATSLAGHDIVVLSGMAKGIDETAHQACIDNYGLTIAVLGEGILFSRLSKAVSLLRQNILESGSVIISEYLPDDPPSERTFLRRNALIVALSKAVIPIEFPKRQSGTGSTILHSRRTGIPVIGILPRQPKAKSMQATRENFASEKIQINIIGNDLNDQIVEILYSLLPEHQWYPQPSIQYRRAIPVLGGDPQRVIDRLQLDEATAEAFIEEYITWIREHFKRQG